MVFLACASRTETTSRTGTVWRSLQNPGITVSFVLFKLEFNFVWFLEQFEILRPVPLEVRIFGEILLEIREKQRFFKHLYLVFLVPTSSSDADARRAVWNTSCGELKN